MSRRPPSDAAAVVARLTASRIVAYSPVLAEALGGIEEALLYQQIAYWSERATDPDGWFWKTQEQFQSELAMSRRNQETARRNLRALGVIEEDRRGVPAKLWFRAVPAAVVPLLLAPSLNGANAPDSMAETAMQERPKPPTIKRKTETTTETTAESSPPTPLTGGAGSEPYHLFQILCEELHADEAEAAPAFKSKQCAAARRILAQGYTPDETRACVRYLASQGWRTSPVDLMTVEKEIGKWRLAGRPDREPARVVPLNGRGTQAATNLDRLRRMIVEGD